MYGSQDGRPPKQIETSEPAQAVAVVSEDETDKAAKAEVGTEENSETKKKKKKKTT